MRLGSLFAGIGGFDLAAERVGMTVAWQSEVDEKASTVLAHHWPEVPNYGDIHDIRPTSGRRLRGSDVHDRHVGVPGGEPNVGSADAHIPSTEDGHEHRESPAAVDVLTGGFPCQDYSVAGTRGGLAGDRGALWWEYHRLITELRPAWVVGENVPGLLSSRGGADFETIVGSLTECGYGVAWAVLDAQYFGVAQRRRRLFIVGHSGGEPRPEILALSEGLFGHPEPSRETGSGTTTSLTQGLGTGGPDFAHADAGWLVPETVGALRQRDWKGPPVDVEEPSLVVEFTDYLRDLGVEADGRGIVGVGLSEGLGSHPEESEFVGRDSDGVFHDSESTIPGGGVKAFAQNQRDEVRDLGDLAGGLQSEPGMKQQTYVLQGAGKTSQGSQGSGWKVEESFTLNTTDEHGIANGSTVRRLTPLECERLQGFPDGWTGIPGNSDTQRYRQLGNAVAVPVVEWILGNIKGAA